eukprot:7019710-Prymnesium_polylepis.3
MAFARARKISCTHASARQTMHLTTTSVAICTCLGGWLVPGESRYLRQWAAQFDAALNTLLAPM